MNKARKPEEDLQSKQVFVFLSPSKHEQFSQACAECGMPMSSIVNELIDTFLEKFQKVKSGQSKAIALEESAKSVLKMNEITPLTISGDIQDRLADLLNEIEHVLIYQNR